MNAQVGIPPPLFILPEGSDILNVVMCTVYDLSCDVDVPTSECIASATESMKKYGMTPLQRFISRGMPLYNTFLNRAPLCPMATYAFAGAENLEDLAVATSSYTLHLKLHLLPDETVAKMGVSYHYRLHKLHGTRIAALKGMLDSPLFPHVAKPHCSARQRQIVSRAYNLATAQVFYNASPGTSPNKYPRVTFVRIHDSLMNVRFCCLTSSQLFQAELLRW